MGKDLLLISGLCWGALLLLILGAFSRRFRFLRMLGVVIQVFACLLYLLGLAGTVALFYSAYEWEGWMAITALIGFFTIVPLGLCSWYLLKAVLGKQRSRGHAAPSGENN